ncbi:MAG: aminoacyl-tRNA hydrolase [Desulfobulbaceae bacterium]|nr:aminoacyl-tRNA hydrolase [Desulfobulbaceae bacterium]
MAMYLIAGLGNPGQQYAGTRHNVGFMALDHLARKNNLAFADSKWKALVAKALLWSESVVLLKPETFMNLSGASVAQAAHFYKLQPSDIIVIHDDLDLEFGRIKIVSGGGDGGHKGIRSIIEHLGTKDFPRIKIGIGRPPAPVLPEKYVLGKFESDEKELIEQKMSVVLESIRVFLKQGIAAAMNVINQKESQIIS